MVKKDSCSSVRCRFFSDLRDSTFSLKKCLNDIKDNISQKRQKLDITYDQISGGSDYVKAFFLKNRECVAQDSYLLLCDACTNAFDDR